MNFKEPHSESARGFQPQEPLRRPRRSTVLTSRLMGMETEYATLVADPQNLDAEDLPPSYFVYEQICEAIRRDQPTVRGLFDNDQIFLASGGAVSFESHRSMRDSPGGLIEIATPEVRSPEDLVTCQRSIDQLVSQATADSETSFDLRVLKNSSDALGHVYGCQENYEAIVATGFWLVAYRAIIAILWCMQVVSFVAMMPMLWCVMFLGALLRFARREATPFDGEPETTFNALPPRLSGLFVAMLRLVHYPTVIVLRFLVKHIAFRPQRRYLTAFLASRVALCGSGCLDHEGRFRLSAKAMAIDVISDMGGFRGEKPVFVFGHWLSQFCTKSFFSLSSTRQMFSRRQRLQIGLSDSNMADCAEFVKVGSASLLLDMIEDGDVKQLPVLKQCIGSIHRIASDWNLISRVPTNHGELSAIEIQRMYFNAAKEFVAKTPMPWIGEAVMVLKRWEELLDAMTEVRRNAENVEAAIGRVDWLTKHWMIQHLGDDASWASKKKVDLRYHELSDDGYYHQLVAAMKDVQFVQQDQIDRRRRSPPAGSPASRRGWVIREFADSDELIHAEWTHAIIGRGRKRRRVEFYKPHEPN